MSKIAGYQPGAVGIDGWFFGIARNVVLETYRAGARQTPADPAFLNETNTDHAPDPALVILPTDGQAPYARHSHERCSVCAPSSRD